MGKAKKEPVPVEARRTSDRLNNMKKSKPALVEKKRAPPKKTPKAKKPKQAENGNTKAEEPKTEATEAK